MNIRFGHLYQVRQFEPGHDNTLTVNTLDTRLKRADEAVTFYTRHEVPARAFTFDWSHCLQNAGAPLTHKQADFYQKQGLGPQVYVATLDEAHAVQRVLDLPAASEENEGPPANPAALKEGLHDQTVRVKVGNRNYGIGLGHLVNRAHRPNGSGSVFTEFMRSVASIFQENGQLPETIAVSTQPFGDGDSIQPQLTYQTLKP